MLQINYIFDIRIVYVLTAQAMNGRFFAGNAISCDFFDGTNYKVDEVRLKDNWHSF
jgi:hypothetical protein